MKKILFKLNSLSSAYDKIKWKKDEYKWYICMSIAPYKLKTMMVVGDGKNII